MNSTRKLDSFGSGLNSGLAGVTYKSGPEFQLPDAGVLSVAEIREREGLSEIFAVQDIAAFIVAGLCPPRGLPPQHEMLWRLDELQDAVARLGEEHPELAAQVNEVCEVLLGEMRNRTALKMNLDALLAG